MLYNFTDESILLFVGSDGLSTVKSFTEVRQDRGAQLISLPPGLTCSCYKVALQSEKRLDDKKRI